MGAVDMGDSWFSAACPEPTQDPLTHKTSLLHPAGAHLWLSSTQALGDLTGTRWWPLRLPGPGAFPRKPQPAASTYLG